MVSILKKRKIPFYKEPTLKDTYFIHDHYNCPFIVKINKNSTISVYARDTSIDPPENYYKTSNFKKYEYLYTKCVYTAKPKKIFIGMSPKNSLTKLSKYYGKKYDGNTIFLQLNNSEYVYIGWIIYKVSINKQKEIVNYISQIGYNDIPFPYAIDNDGMYYLFDANAIIDIPYELMMKDDNPYEIFHENKLKSVKMKGIKVIYKDKIYK
jgi:hypothetical protein